MFMPPPVAKSTIDGLLKVMTTIKDDRILSDQRAEREGNQHTSIGETNAHTY
jgi:hypothetical protein